MYIGDLIDQGVDVRFAHDDLRLDSRGGRLAADIQAVIAADYIRNLREEVRKGIQGRLRQGVYPFSAPVGYLDRGAGKAKIPDPVRGPLVAEGFALYAKGGYNARAFANEMGLRGLRNHRGNFIDVTAWLKMLHNPFYAGTIRIHTTGQEYPGLHAPLVSRALFDRVQEVIRERRRHQGLRGRLYGYTHFVRCYCGRRLTGERQKAYVYYRCHRCVGVSYREEYLTAAFAHLTGLSPNTTTPSDIRLLASEGALTNAGFRLTHR